MKHISHDDSWVLIYKNLSKERLFRNSSHHNLLFTSVECSFACNPSLRIFFLAPRPGRSKKITLEFVICKRGFFVVVISNPFLSTKLLGFVFLLLPERGRKIWESNWILIAREGGEDFPSLAWKFKFNDFPELGIFTLNSKTYSSI